MRCASALCLYGKKLLATEIAVEQQDIEQAVTDLQQVINTTERSICERISHHPFSACLSGHKTKRNLH